MIGARRTWLVWAICAWSLIPLLGQRDASESIEARKSGSSRSGSGFVSSTVRQRNRRALWNGPIGVCAGGLLAKRRVDFLERVIQGNLKKISSSMAIFRRWAREKGLKPSETQYMRHSRTGTVVLQFSKSGDPGIEKSYRTHFVSPELSEKKEQRLQEKLNQSPKPIVFQNVREAHCSECGAEIEQGSFLSMELEQPLCLQCARLDDLEFLPSGDAALTRRASKYRGRVAVVVRFSRSRGRYERKGILVETPGLEKAERECLEDADERVVARGRGAERRRKQDVELAAQMIKQITMLFPGCPANEVADIAEHTPEGEAAGWVAQKLAGISRKVP